MYGRGNSMGFGPPVTPNVIKNLMIANGVVYIAQWVAPRFTDLFAVSPIGVWHFGHFWQPFTYMWLHSPGSPFHLIFNMFSLWMFGSSVALHWGDQRFLRFYLTCGVGAGVMIASIPYLPLIFGISQPSWLALSVPTLGASGAVMAVLLAYALTWPDRTIMLIFPPIPLKAIWLIPFILFMEFTSGPSNVSHTGHLGGLLVGWIYLVNEGRTPGAPTISSLRHRYRRYQMRKNLRAVRAEEDRDRRNLRNDDKWTH